jgi:predicted N-formylglutamate amidohydrolase
MQPITISASAAYAPVVLTCEHASAAVPDEYANLGLAPAQLVDHIGWDIGAAAVAEELSRGLGVPAVLSAASRLLVDCNRELNDADLMPHESHGIAVPGNAAIDVSERDRRLAHFYDPYHAAVDAQLARCPRALLLSVHSFTPELNGSARPFDIGVLYDDFDALAVAFARHLTAAGFAARMNEPYSGLAGLIFSARSHGRRHGLRYLELEINNRLLRTDRDIIAVASRLLDAVATTAATETMSDQQ